ncbi:RidA family protein [Pseudomonas sichuanensis]|uniref:RidA family protein n=1 Tax=Pseudomonas sichuanensis TaxID=2213015 RepID=UPI002ABBAAF3|nr:RidA family protein [Pseudomonas sichuanensis]MDZ4019275.1 2-iminobutanoate/2-iminopropanoate deaminase [Pseudomonas sichuanensis]
MSTNTASQTSKPVNTPFYVTGEWGFVSGLTGRYGDTLVPGGFEAEFTCVLDRLQKMLAERSLTIKDIVKINLYLSDMRNRERLNEMYLDFFGDHLPARTVVGVTEIARKGAVELEAMVQIKAK